MFAPSYLELRRTGELHERVELAYRLMSPNCELCPRRCGVDRLAGEIGACRTGSLPVVANFGPHFGEELPLVGINGSGTIFFGNCNLQCVFCQNYDISHGEGGEEITIVALVDMMLSLARQGCHNINLVTPTHQIYQILSALEIAVEAGLDLPIVYNSGGYESVQTLEILDGIVDIYMPDAKFGSNEVGMRLSGRPCKHGHNRTAQSASAVPDYWDRNMEAIWEMHRQVGDLALDDRGVAQSGLLVRHLVLPGNLADTREVMHFLATEISADTYVNVMAQYHPEFRAPERPLINRPITPEEREEALNIARVEGIWRFAK